MWRVAGVLRIPAILFVNRLVRGAQHPPQHLVFVKLLLTTVEARTHVWTQLLPMTVDEIKLKATAIYDAGIELMRFLIALDLVPDLPGERVRGVNTPQARKRRRKE